MNNVTFVKPISADTITHCKELRNKLNLLEGEIIDRLNYIIYTMFSMWGINFDTWYFEGAEEGEVGNLWRNYASDEISGLVLDFDRHEEEYNSGSITIIDKDGDEWQFYNSIPTRWLFEPFEGELAKGKELFFQQEIARKEALKTKRAKQKEKDLKLAEAAKAKLSPEEIAALKKTL